MHVLTSTVRSDVNVPHVCVLSLVMTFSVRVFTMPTHDVFKVKRINLDTPGAQGLYSIQHLVGKKRKSSEKFSRQHASTETDAKPIYPQTSFKRSEWAGYEYYIIFILYCACETNE